MIKFQIEISGRKLHKGGTVIGVNLGTFFFPLILSLSRKEKST